MKEDPVVGEGNDNNDKADTSIDVNKDDGGSDDEDEAVLEAMLDAEAGGYGEFEDDFDEIEGDEVAEEHSDEDVFDDGDDEPGLLFGKREKATDSLDIDSKPTKKLKG